MHVKMHVIMAAILPGLQCVKLDNGFVSFIAQSFPIMKFVNKIATSRQGW